MPSAPLQTPGRSVPPFAVSFANAAGDSEVVSAATPLPVSPVSAAGPVALTGTATTSGLVGPFLPVSGRPVMLALSGTWAGQIKIQRSTDGGATRLPLTALGQVYGVYSGNLCEPIWEEGESGARLYLDVTLTSGSLSYRMGQ